MANVRTGASLMFPRRPRGWLLGLAWRWPFACFLLVMLASNVAGSAFSILYNRFLIVEGMLNEAQRRAFFHLALPLYNVLAYPGCVAALIVLLWPVRQCWLRLSRREPVDEACIERCRRRLVNIPFWQLFVNMMGWLPGAVFFPAVILAAGGADRGWDIGLHFGLSFVVSGVFTTVQTFFWAEAYLIAVLYPVFLKGIRPADIKGVVRIPFFVRLGMLWCAVAVMPLLSVAMVVWNFAEEGSDHAKLTRIALAVTATGTLSGLAIAWIVGKDLQRWLDRHAAATDAIGRELFDTRIDEVRPDEWGELTNRFNDMAAKLKRGQEIRDTFGEFQSPEIRDQILERFHGLEVVDQEITVLFADIRGFTKRCAGAPPERVGKLLNRFLSLAFNAIEAKGGYINKVLGDGVMALFGLAEPTGHAGLAVACAQEMLLGLERLNAELVATDEAPLAVGIGIHTGPVVVGCFGATLRLQDGGRRTRREFTAIGETVNYSQRLEQMTKLLGGPVLLSEKTRIHLHDATGLENLGPNALPGSNEVMVVYRLVAKIG